jgi:predicted PurR-regulated permease PerM
MKDLILPAEPSPVLPGEPEAASATDSSTPVVPERRPAIRLVPALAVIVGLWWTQVVLIPLVLSVLITYALEPLVTRLEAAHIVRPLAVPLLLMALVGGMGVGIYSLRTEAMLFIEQLPEAARTVRDALQPAPSAQRGAVAKVQQAAQELEQAATEAVGPKTAPAGVTPVRIEEPTFKWSDYLWEGSRGMLEFGGQLFVILCLVYYFLASGDLYKRKLVRMVGSSHRRRKRSPCRSWTKSIGKLNALSWLVCSSARSPTPWCGLALGC